MSTSGRILADFHPIRTYFGFFNPLRLFIFENGAASTFIRPSTFIPEVRVVNQQSVNFFFFLGFPLLDFDGGGQEDDDSLTRSTYQSAMHGLTNILLILLGAFYRDPLPTSDDPPASSINTFLSSCPFRSSLADVLLDLGGCFLGEPELLFFLS